MRIFLAAALLLPGLARATQYGFVLPPPPTDAGSSRPSTEVVLPAAGAMPTKFSIKGACAGCDFALVRASSSRVSTDDSAFTFDDPAKRYAHPVVLHLGLSDSDGSSKPGAFWGPGHEGWAIVPVAADGTVSGEWAPGMWYASFANGAPTPMGQTFLRVEVVAALSSDAKALPAHFESARREVYRFVGGDAIAVDEPLPAGVAGDADLYLGAVEVDRVSTDQAANKIAQTAGVSVGTLYQYFPSKESLIAELIDRSADKMMGLMVSELASLGGAPIEEVARRVVKAVLASFVADAPLNRVLFTQWQSVGRLYKLRENEARAAQIIRVYLEANRARVRVKNVEIASLLLVHLIDTMANVFTTIHPKLLADPAFTEEMVDLVTRYLLAG